MAASARGKDEAHALAERSMTEQVQELQASLHEASSAEKAALVRLSSDQDQIFELEIALAATYRF